jgi:hypothetical protein
MPTGCTATPAAAAATSGLVLAARRLAGGFSVAEPGLVWITLGGVGGWLWLSPGELRIDVDPRSREIALLFPPEARGRPPAEAVARALAM